MKVQLKTDWTDSDMVRHKAGTIIDMDTAFARRLTSTGVAEAVPYEKSIGATKNKMVGSDAGQDKAPDPQPPSVDLEQLKKKAKKK